MRFIASIAGLALALTAATAVANITAENSEKANAVIDAAIEAYGGAERLGQLATLVVEAETTGFLVDQSRGTEAPWDQNGGDLYNAIDLDNRQFVSRNRGDGAGFEFDTGQIINGEASYQLDYRAGTAAPLTAPDFDTTSGPFIRVTPLLLVRQLMDRRTTAHWLGAVDVEGRAHDVVTLVMTVGPALSLYFDRETHLLTRSERILPGFGLVEYRFDDYHTADGFPLNRRFRLAVNGDPNLDWRYTSVWVNESFEERLTPPDALERIAAVAPDDLSLQELSPGVYLVGGGGTYAMFVEMKDHVVAIGGTAGIPDRIAELRKQVPSKPIRYGVMTHHHSDHVLGVPAYAAEGATVVAARAHEAVMREAAGDAGMPEFEFVDESRVLTDGSRIIELYDIGPTPHAEHILLPYLPAEGIVFQADHVATPRTGPLPPAISNHRALAEAIESRGLKVKTIAGAHSPRVIGVEEFEAALGRDTRVAQQSP